MRPNRLLVALAMLVAVRALTPLMIGPYVDAPTVRTIVGQFLAAYVLAYWVEVAAAWVKGV